MLNFPASHEINHGSTQKGFYKPPKMSRDLCLFPPDPEVPILSRLVGSLKIVQTLLVGKYLFQISSERLIWTASTLIIANKMRILTT